MVYYIVAFLLTLLLCKRFGVSHITNRGVKVALFPRIKTALIVLMPLILLALFRWNVGADSVYGSSYWEAYHQSKDGLNARDFAPGFYWFMRFFAELETPFFWFLFAHGVFFFAAVSLAIYKGSAWGTWSIALFFLLTVYFDSYSSLRQSLAEAICLIGWALMGTEQKSLKKDITILTLFFVSTLFHSTGWLNIPIYLLCKLHFKSRTDVLIFALAAVAMTPILQKMIPAAMNALSTNEAYKTLGLARTNIAVTGMFFLIVWMFYDEVDSCNENGYMYVNQALYIFILILNSGAMYLPYRVYDMLKIGYIFIIPQVLASISDWKSRFFVQLGFAGVCIATFAIFITLPGSPYANYQSALPDFWNIINLP